MTIMIKSNSYKFFWGLKMQVKSSGQKRQVCVVCGPPPLKHRTSLPSPKNSRQDQATAAAGASEQMSSYHSEWQQTITFMTLSWSGSWATHTDTWGLASPTLRWRPRTIASAWPHGVARTRWLCMLQDNRAQVSKARANQTTHRSLSLWLRQPQPSQHFLDEKRRIMWLYDRHYWLYLHFIWLSTWSETQKLVFSICIKIWSILWISRNKLWRKIETTCS